MPENTRCAWAKDPYDIAYHDTEWGVPQHDDQKLFELLILEGMQAGLSWNLILRRREGMRQAFDGFDPVVIARYDDAKKAELLQNPAIIRNRRKIDALVDNARAFLQTQKDFGSFGAWLWAFVENKPVVNHWTDVDPMPATSPISDAMSKALKKRGFRFVGSTICYSFMQAAGLVDDHMVGCPFKPQAAGKQP